MTRPKDYMKYDGRKPEPPYVTEPDEELAQHLDGEHRAILAAGRNDAYRKANPLGGPAAMFRTIAERLEAGEDYHAVLTDYGLVHSEKPADADSKARDQQ